jgi:hypothetical protein
MYRPSLGYARLTYTNPTLPREVMKVNLIKIHGMHGFV